MFRNLMGCGRVDGTKEPTAVVKSTVNKRENKGSSIVHYNCVTLLKGQQDHQIYASSGKPWIQQPNGCKTSRRGDIKGEYHTREDIKKSANEKSMSAAYRPINGPKCSQCKRRFKPEKMHSHMKSCKGMKLRIKVSIEESINETINMESAPGLQLER